MGQESRPVLYGYLIFFNNLQLQSYENLQIEDSGLWTFSESTNLWWKLSELKRAIFFENCVYIF